MTQATVPVSPVPTSQRPLNGAISGGGALLTDALVRVALARNPELAVLVSPIAGLAASAVLATLGDAARKRLQSKPPSSFVGEVLLGMLARIG